MSGTGEIGQARVGVGKCTASSASSVTGTVCGELVSDSLKPYWFGYVRGSIFPMNREAVTAGVSECSDPVYWSMNLS